MKPLPQPLPDTGRGEEKHSQFIPQQAFIPPSLVGKGARGLGQK